MERDQMPSMALFNLASIECIDATFDVMLPT